MHILNRDGIIIQTTLKEDKHRKISLKNIIGFPIQNLMLKSNLTSINSALKKIDKNNHFEYVGYTRNNEPYISLLDKIDDDIVISHECKEIDIRFRKMVKRKLFLSSSRWYDDLKSKAQRKRA